MAPQRGKRLAIKRIYQLHGVAIVLKKVTSPVSIDVSLFIWVDDAVLRWVSN